MEKSETDSGNEVPTSFSSTDPEHKRLQKTQAEVDEIVDIMRINVDKVIDRDRKLNELQQIGEGLVQSALDFELQAGKLKRKSWWTNIKLLIIMGVIGTLLLVIMIATLMSSGNENLKEKHV